MLLFFASIVVILGHERHFPGHPEWDNLWPDPPSLNDLKNGHESLPPDLSGVWHGSPAGGEMHRYFFTPSGGGYGSAKDRMPGFLPAAPGTAYDIACLTKDWTSKASGGCGWAVARAALNQDEKTGEWTANITFMDEKHAVVNQLSGPVSADGNNIAMHLPWNRYAGELSGLWKGPTGDDYYVVTHEADQQGGVQGNLTVWWDSAETAIGSWYTGRGKIDNLRNVDVAFDSFNLSGVASANASDIGGGTWGSPWTKRVSQTLPTDIHTVHLVFMNHLDIGYTTTVNNVLNEYIHQYYTQVAKLSDEMRAKGTDRFVYTTHPWLMSLLLDCPCASSGPNCTALTLNNSRAPPLKCPSDEEIDTFKKHVNKGDIVWHAAAMNMQVENMSPELIDAGLALTRAFDAQFYADSEHNETITMSDRDVIYVTRATLPYLAKWGVKGLTIGSNGADYPPQVPKLHVWRDPASGAEVIVAYHPYGYGGYGKSTCAGPGQCGDCAEAPNGVALCTEFRSDNRGPPESVDEVTKSLDAVRQEYPNANVFASTFDNFIRDVLPVKDKLPVFEKEVGDTWMYGAPSDPLKMAQSRELLRTWSECLDRERAEGGASRDADSCEWSRSPAIRNMSRFLMKTPEHTWGTPGIGGRQNEDYDTKILQKKLGTDPYLAAASSWAEQRIYNELAVAALETAKHPLASEARRRYALISRVSAPDVSGMQKSADPSSPVVLAGAVKMAFDATGAVVALGSGKTSWASPDKPLAAVIYQTLNESDWSSFTYDYINGHSEASGFCKPGSNTYTKSAHWRPVLQALYTNDVTAVVEMEFPSEVNGQFNGGAPEKIFINVTALNASRLVLELVWLGKKPTSVGESTMLTFAPAPALSDQGGAWKLDKVGTWVDPENVVDGGNQFNHGVWTGGARVTTADGSVMQVRSLDAPNMCPQTSDFPWGNPLPAGSDGLKQLKKGSVFGMGINLHNNLWNTNYPLFYPYFDPAYCASPSDCADKNARFRLQIDISE